MSSIGKRQQKPTKRTTTTTSNVQKPTRSGFKTNGKFRAMSNKEERKEIGPVDTRERNVHRRDRLHKKEDRKARYDERGLFMHLPRGYGKVGYGYNTGFQWAQEPEHTAKFGVTSTRTSRHYQNSSQLKTKFGSGVVVRGCQYFSNITILNASNLLLETGTIAELRISPDALGGRCALVARTYSKYRFTKLIFHYDAGCPTTTSGQGFMAYIHDPMISSFQSPSYGTLQSAEDSLAMIPFESCSMNVNLRGKEDTTYYTEIDSVSTPGIRQTEQGTFYAFAQTNGSAAVAWGTMQIEFEMELYDPSPDYGFTLTLPDQVMITMLPVLQDYMTPRDVLRVRRLKGETLQRVYEVEKRPETVNEDVVQLLKLLNSTPKDEKKYDKKKDDEKSERKEEPPVKKRDESRERSLAPMDVEPKGWDRVENIPDYYVTQRNEQQKEFEKELQMPRLTPRVDIRDVKDGKDLMKKLEVLKREGK